MKTFVCYRVELEFVKDGLIGLVTDLKVNDVRSRGVCETLKLFCIDGEKDILYTTSIKYTWYETLTTEGFDYLLAADLAEHAIKFKMLHSLIKF